MTPLVLTLIGDDRAGLVSAVAAEVTRHGGNWEESQMAELAGKFAGIVLVTVPDDQVEGFVAAMEPLHGLLDVNVQRAGAIEPSDSESVSTWSLAILGADRPGIVSEISAVLSDHRVNIDALETSTREAPMAGQMLFEASARLEMSTDTDVAALRAALEGLAHELMVDIDFGTA